MHAMFPCWKAHFPLLFWEPISNFPSLNRLGFVLESEDASAKPHTYGPYICTRWTLVSMCMQAPWCSRTLAARHQWATTTLRLGSRWRFSPTLPTYHNSNPSSIISQMYLHQAATFLWRRFHQGHSPSSIRKLLLRATERTATIWTCTRFWKKSRKALLGRKIHGMHKIMNLKPSGHACARFSLLERFILPKRFFVAFSAETLSHCAGGTYSVSSTASPSPSPSAATRSSTDTRNSLQASLSQAQTISSPSQKEAQASGSNSTADLPPSFPWPTLWHWTRSLLEVWSARRYEHELIATSEIIVVSKVNVMYV